MQTRCISGDRELIVQILERETGRRARTDFAPGFSCRVGAFTLTRAGLLCTEEDGEAVFTLLAELGLCDYPLPPMTPAPGELAFPMEGHSGATLTNLIHILSARQILLNRALAAPGAFAIGPEVLKRLAAHPPETREAFLQALYPFREACRGVHFGPVWLRLTGLERARKIPPAVCRQLGERIVAAALSQRWVKPHTHNLRNKKYVMHNWLNTLGMCGEVYAEARSVLLRELPGRTDVKTERKEAQPRG